MCQLKVLRAVDYPRMPWKNGGGSTEEITRDAGTGLDGFGWRLSTVERSFKSVVQRVADLARVDKFVEAKRLGRPERCFSFVAAESFSFLGV